MSKTKCCFTNSNTSCSSDFITLDALDKEEELSVYGELHLLPSSLSKSFQICTTHRQQVEADVKKRCRRKECEVNSILGSLAIHSKKRAGDRHVTGPMFKKVAENTGVFLPVAICRLCREKLLVSEAPAVQENSETHETKDDVKVMPCEQLSEPPSKRKKIYSMSSVYEYYSHGKEDLSERKQTESERQHDGDYVLSQPSQSSEASEDSVMEVDKRESLNNFLSHFDISPVKEPKKLFSISSERSQRRYTNKAKQCIDSILTVICPNESDLLYSTMLKHVEEKSDLIMKEIYLQGESWQFRRQILSILVQQKSFEECQKIIPSITSWRYYEAKNHGKMVGVGVPVPETTPTREKIDSNSLEYFIDFITSSHIIKDLPFGLKTLKLESGEIVKIPNVVRSLSASTIVDQYQQICDIDNVSPLDSHFIGRRKRSWSPLQQALRTILKGTQRQPFTSRNELIVYNKKAGFDEAVQDFYSLEPTIVRQNRHGALVGNVGDVYVFLRGPDKKRHLVATLVVPGGQHAKIMGFPSQFKTTRVINYVSED